MARRSRVIDTKLKEIHDREIEEAIRTTAYVIGLVAMIVVIVIAVALSVR
jgi:hypothetical protein